MGLAHFLDYYELCLPISDLWYKRYRYAFGYLRAYHPHCLPPFGELRALQSGFHRDGMATNPQQWHAILGYYRKVGYRPRRRNIVGPAVGRTVRQLFYPCIRHHHPVQSQYFCNVFQKTTLFAGRFDERRPEIGPRYLDR